ncbi:MAG TPA: hypothetical protein VJR91_24915, partial [Burkholderia sp.]|nr:hypothetical protein [Burkholderia sp.]
MSEEKDQSERKICGSGKCGSAIWGAGLNAAEAVLLFFSATASVGRRAGMKRYAVLAQTIADAIRRGDLGAGARIPTVRAACNAYRV